MLSATTQSTEWISTKTRLPLPRPNHRRASGSRAMAGSGLNMLVSVSSRSLPMRVLMAATDRMHGEADADGVAHQQHADRGPGAVGQHAVADVGPEGAHGVGEGREQQVVVEVLSNRPAR